VARQFHWREIRRRRKKLDSVNGGQAQSEGGQKFLPPNPLPSCPPERLDFKVRDSDFRQKMFELRPRSTARELVL